MVEHASAVLTPWSNFCIMTGSAAAALTGLMFVVLTLVNREQRFQSNDGIGSFSTPTVLHFCAALLTSAVLVAPWRSLVEPAAVLGIASLYSIVHVVRASGRARRLSSYTPDLADWISYTVLPLAGYAALLGGSIALPWRPIGALFALAGAVMALLFIGIRNSWDIVTYIVIGPADSPGADETRERSGRT